jgi:hypothetical protein
LASPPQSHNSSPIFFQGSSSGLENGKLSPCRFIDPKDLHDSTDFSQHAPEGLESNWSDLGKQPQDGVESDVMPRSRKSSLLSSTSGSSEDDAQDGRSTAEELEKTASEDREEGGLLMGVELKGPLSHLPEDGVDIFTTKGIDSKGSPPGSSENEEDHTVVGDVNEPLPDSSDEEEEPSIPSGLMDPSSDEEDEPMIDGESNAPSAESSDGGEESTVFDEMKGPTAGSSDNEEDPKVTAKSKQPSRKLTDDEEMLLKEPMPELSDDEEMPLKEPSPELSDDEEMPLTEPSPELSDDDELPLKKSSPELSDDEEMLLKEPSREVSVEGLPLPDFSKGCPSGSNDVPPMAGVESQKHDKRTVDVGAKDQSSDMMAVDEGGQDLDGNDSSKSENFRAPDSR